MSFLTWIATPYFVDYSQYTGQEPYFMAYAHDIAFSKLYKHTFCGSHETPGAWCPNCDKPLLRLLALDTNDPRLGLEPDHLPLLSLFYCWTCAICAGLFYYRFQRNEGIVLLDYGQEQYKPDVLYPNYPVYFPESPAHLVQIKPEVQHLIQLLNSQVVEVQDLSDECYPLYLPRHQVGGEPFLVQRYSDYLLDPDYGIPVKCVICGTLMPFLASIGDHCLDPRGFTGNEFVQVLFHYCKTCQVIGAFNQCD